MRTLKLLMIAVIVTLAFGSANAQIHLPPHPPGPHGGPPPPPKLHIKTPNWLKSKHRSTKRVVLHRPPAPHRLHVPPPPRHP